MKKIENYKILLNEEIAKDTFKMLLNGDTSWIKKPGQFINITIKNQYLKRPISVCDYNRHELCIIYKVVGKGTLWLSRLKQNDIIEALVDLGNGFSIMDEDDVLVVGGGVGIPPLLNLCKKLKSLNKKVTAVIGFNTKEDLMLINEFSNTVNKLHICTMDGSAYEKGNVIDIIDKYALDKPYYTCGPKQMLKALVEKINYHGLVSLEERIGCGFGACMGCSIKVKEGYKRVCVEGPVLKSEEIIWTD